MVPLVKRKCTPDAMSSAAPTGQGNLFEHAGEVFSLPFSRHDGTGSQTVDTNPTGQFTGEVEHELPKAGLAGRVVG